jgi:hypothetical protein
MRITVNLPEDVYQVARSLASLKGTSIGDALAELVRAGLRPSAKMNTKKAFPCFDLPADAKPITLEQTLEAEDGL